MLFKLVFMTLKPQLNLTPCLQSLFNLKGIDLSNSRFLKELPDLSNAPRVERIVARGCTDLVTIPTPRYKLESLEHLDLSECSKVKEFPEIS